MQEEGADAVQLGRELAALERKVAGIVVPLSYADELCALRNNINLVRRQLQERGGLTGLRRHATPGRRRGFSLTRCTTPSSCTASDDSHRVSAGSEGQNGTALTA